MLWEVWRYENGEQLKIMKNYEKNFSASETFWLISKHSAVSIH